MPSRSQPGELHHRQSNLAKSQFPLFTFFATNKVFAHKQKFSSNTVIITANKKNATVDKSVEEELKYFSKIDKDNDQYLVKEEVISNLRRMNLPTSEEYLSDLYAQYDLNKDKKISFSEFLNYLKKKEGKFKAVFHHFSKNTNFITPESCLESLQDLGLSATIEDARLMVRSIDRNQDKKISYEEFREYVSMLPSSQLNSSLIMWDWLTSSAKEYSASPPIANTMRQLLAGGIAGCIAKTVLAPIDRLRTLVIAGTFASAGNSILKIAQSLLKSEGVRGFYKGNSTALIKVFPSKSISFTVHDGMKNILRGRSSTGRLSVPGQLLSSATAGVVTQSIIHPLDVIQIRQSLGESGNLFTVASRTVKNEGMGALYRGLPSALFAELLGLGLGLFAYDFSCNLFEKVTGRKAQPGDKALVAACSSFCTTTVTMPVYVVQKLLMSQGNPGVPVYHGFFDTVKQVAMKDGLKGFFRGAGLTYMRLIPSTALTFYLYETFQKRFGVGGLYRYKE